jgi:hypothetical protein
MSGEKVMCLRDTIVPKSDQLNFDDVQDRPLTVKVTGLAAGSDEQPVIVRVANSETGVALRDYKPCKTMRRVLIAIWGEKGKDWMGKTMTLFGDPTAKFGKDAVGGIRISHMSGITVPVRLMLTVSRGKRSEYVVQPIKAQEGAAV